MDDDSWPTARQVLAEAGDAVTFVRLRPSAPAVPAPEGALSEPAPRSTADVQEVHVVMLGGSGQRKTLCDCLADPDLVEVVTALGDRPCLLCVARAAELACETEVRRR
jgi:hypothetical protein